MKKSIFETTESLLDGIDSFFSDQLDSSRTVTEGVIFRNLLYYCGFQDIEYFNSTRSFRRKRDSIYTKKPVSNEVREYVRSIKSMLMNQKMVPRVWPNTNEKEDELASELGQDVLVWMDQSHDEQFFDEKEKCIIWLCLSGTAFMRTFPDIDGGRWVAGEDGLWKTGDVATECFLPFNVRMDSFGDRLEQKQWIGMQSLKPREWVEDTFKIKVDRPDKDKGIIDYQTQISKMVSDVSPFGGGPAAGSIPSGEDDDMVLFREVEFKPQADYPFGRYVVSAGGKILKIYERLPIKSTLESWYYSLTDFHYNYVPGRFWSDPPVNDIISPQNIINSIDQALVTNREGIGRPRITTAGEIGLKKLDLGGQGFLAMTYNPIMGMEPKIHEGTPLPQQVLEERRLQKEQLQDLGGDPKNVLRGNVPSAQSSGVQVDILRETVEQGKAPDLDRFNRALTRVYKKRLILAQEMFTEERLIKVTGRGNKVKIAKFKGSDLRGNTDVRLELDSGLISTKSGQAQMIINMIQAGFFKEGEISPTLRQEVLQRMGLATFTDETNTDVERAEAENVAVAAGTGEVMTVKMNPQTGKEDIVTDDPLFKYDDHKAHYETHRKFIISPEFKEIPFETMAKLVYHCDYHQKQIQDAPPDIRDFVQIDKLLAANILTPSERAQILTKYLGIEPGTETETGLPSADVVVKAKQKMIDVDKKLVLSREQMETDLLKHGISEGVKASAIQSKPQPAKKGK